MDANQFDKVTRLFANRRLSRRRALAQGVVGLMATGAAAGLAAATSAQEATPVAQEATPVPTGSSDREKTEFLFLQSFQAGTIVPKDGEAGTWTLTLEQGLGQTVYFSDRPERIVGVSPTDKFLQGLGFDRENPPNAALLFKNDKGEEDISVVELFNPTYDTATNTATYEIQLLNEYAGLDMTFQQQPTEPPDAQATFGAAHLFIDDCADGTITCCANYDHLNENCPSWAGTIGPTGYCYDWGLWACYPCEPYGRDSSDCEDAYVCELNDYWAKQCNATFAACDGNCTPFYP